MKRLSLDNRLNWRDPNMPVLRLNNKHQMIEVDPDWIRQYYDQKINSPGYGAPSWRNDPTYDIAVHNKKIKNNLK